MEKIGGPKETGRLSTTKNITGAESVYIINQSITGFYEQVIDLKTI